MLAVKTQVANLRQGEADFDERLNATLDHSLELGEACALTLAQRAVTPRSPTAIGRFVRWRSPPKCRSRGRTDFDLRG